MASLKISGNVALTSIGQASQLSAIATLTDGTEQDVTNMAAWTSSDVRVATVSSGLVTVVGFGSSNISIRYQTRGGSASLTATPPGTSVISGRVREPGQSGLADVRVTEIGSGRSTTSNAEGAFSIGELPRTQSRFRFEKNGYEPAESDGLAGTYIDAPVQRIIRVAAGETVKPLQLAPNDLSYTIGSTHCFPCRLVRLVVPSAGTVRVRVTWTVNVKLNLFADGQVFTGGDARELSAEIPFGTPREIVMYFGAPSVPAGGIAYVPFTIETSIR